MVLGRFFWGGFFGGVEVEFIIKLGLGFVGVSRRCYSRFLLLCNIGG